MERKERPRVKQEPSPEAGSQLYQETELTETKRFEHDEFLAEVVGKRTANSKHIAIIGEPGAGKTTLLTKIGQWLLNSVSQSEPVVVVWISLASLESQDLSDYLYGNWLKNAHPAKHPPDSWANELANLIINKRVWLLLDGLDETSRSDAPSWLNRQLSGCWGQNLRVAVTCRLNQWDGASNSLVNSFEVYRTLDYEYRTATGEDRVLEFLTKWFGNADTAKQIRTSLDALGKERIKDLVKNPLRLTLFCESWKENQALPETQADLYKRFVTYLYDWNKAEVNLRLKLNPALGKLATTGLNRQPNRDGAVRRFRFTEPEIAKLWQDLPATLLPAAKKLGWLNVVGMEAGDNIYAFFHPTFQEYFAACSIDDWDYFLPKEHGNHPMPSPCKDEREPTYRVFEKEWQQPILLWIGREDVGDKFKEEFIDKLTNFGEQEGKFYYYRAYCLAAICVSEFKDSRSARQIVECLVLWAFGNFNHEIDRWIIFEDSEYPIESLAWKTIPLTYREYAIDVLDQLLAREDISNSHRSDVINELGRIGVGNERAIDVLSQLRARDDLNNDLRSKSGRICALVPASMG
jgi:GTPase SAR1 family protein